ncbi:MAG: hypothetical protein GWN01_16835 [Nitrosopumilaceae archaeon]|nr:hypothetical protein [Nitrosopumilaceae archaeon]NIU02500.1 hypothetical protein [Nitrosopumilaceae archaeon]NIU88961.1 hypothetical protein [Nitrosopumilaceae archaeon]NIV67072.1 hypothetical protein [Nitrosopumilaceae archaeon]NIX63101.1 hypothetical protein [Nitrosopumilaceae archaeon]
MENKENPFFPITIDDYPKIFDYALSPTGLIYFQKLRRSFILGNDLNLDEYNKLRLLHIYYATTNRQVEEVYNWQEMCVRLERFGIPEKDVQNSKKDLIKKDLIVKNPYYKPGFYRKYIEFVNQNKSNTFRS